MNTWDIMALAAYVIGQGKPFEKRVDDPQRTAHNIRQMMRRKKWKGYSIKIKDDAIVITRKVVK